MFNQGAVAWWNRQIYSMQYEFKHTFSERMTPLLLHFVAAVLALPHLQAQAPRGARRVRAKCHNAWLWWMSPHDNRWAAAGVLLGLQQQQEQQQQSSAWGAWWLL
jgi:hypothetical protein